MRGAQARRGVCMRWDVWVGPRGVAGWSAVEARIDFGSAPRVRALLRWRVIGCVSWGARSLPGQRAAVTAQAAQVEMRHTLHLSALACRSNWIFFRVLCASHNTHI